MASSIQLLRSTTARERPLPGSLLEGQPAVNINATEPGLFFKASDGTLVKIGPAAITSDGQPPNTDPAGLTGNSVGELWLDKSLSPPVLKVYDGSAWVDAGSGGGGSSLLTRWVYTAAGGETSLSGTSGGVTLSYTPGTEQVFVNGVLLTRGVDYVATTGSSITGLSPLTTGDVATVLSSVPAAGLFPIASSDVTFLQAGASAVQRTAQSKLRDTVSVKDFGAVGDGVTDDTAAAQAALDHVIAAGGTLYFPAGTYLLNGTAGADGVKNGLNISENYKNIAIVGDGALTTLIAGSDNMYIVRLTSPTTKISNLSLVGGSRPGVTGLGLVPQNNTAAAESVLIIYNTVDQVSIDGCENGIELRQGSTSNSQCYYNRFSNVRINNCTRGVWFRRAPVASSPSINRNSFYAVTIYGGNAGVHLENGDTNTFHSCNFEGVQSGVSPLAVPTSVHIDSADPLTGELVQRNRFVTCTSEACTRAIYNNSAYSEFYGFSNIDIGTNYDFAAAPNVFIGGDNQGQAPTIFPGFASQSGVAGSGVPGLPAETTRISSKNFRLNVDGSDLVQVTASGRVGIGRAPGYFLDIDNNNAQDGQMVAVMRTAGGWHEFYGASSGGANALGAAYKLGANNTTGRSINAGGTINAAGTDYAEYMTKAGDFTIAKGDICGVTSAGLLTDRFDDSVCFLIKSTNPSLVGGDSWGSAELLSGDSDAEIEGRRAMVDRVAFAGRVPVNVAGARPGQYVVPRRSEGGGISGAAIDPGEMTLQDYMLSVGRVASLLDDGRPEILVKVG